MNSSKPLQEAINNLDGLPAIPSIALKVLALKITTDEGERELFQLIEKDPPILSKIIGLSNSSMFGTGRKIITLHDAAVVLGSKRVKMVALSFAMMSSMTRKSPGHLDIDRLWKHSLSIALTMDTLARHMPDHLRPPEDEIYLAGLLHDIGFLVLDYIDFQLSDNFHSRVLSEPGRPVEEMEAEILGISHCELGAALGRHWELPESIIAVIFNHRASNDKHAFVGQPLVAMAILAEKLVPTFGMAVSEQMDISTDDWLALGINPVKADEVITRVQQHIDEVALNHS